MEQRLHKRPGLDRGRAGNIRSLESAQSGFRLAGIRRLFGVSGPRKRFRRGISGAVVPWRHSERILRYAAFRYHSGGAGHLDHTPPQNQRSACVMRDQLLQGRTVNNAGKVPLRGAGIKKVDIGWY